jgi:hypothetical protein
MIFALVEVVAMIGVSLFCAFPQLGSDIRIETLKSIRVYSPVFTYLTLPLPALITLYELQTLTDS